MNKFINFILLTIVATGIVFAAQIGEDTLKIGQPGSSSNKSLFLGDTREIRANESGSKLEFSDDGVTFGGFVDDTNAETIGGVKTFSDLPIFTSGIDSNGNSTVDGTFDVTGDTSVTGKFSVVSTTDGSVPCPKATTAQITAAVGTSVSGDCFFNTDTLTLNVFDGAAFGEVAGGGGGGLNIFYTQDYETDDAADLSTGNSGTFLGGGTINGTVADEDAAQLSDTSSIKYTQAAGSLNDYVTLDTGNIALDLRQRERFNILKFQYTYSGSDDEIKIVVYDVTNAEVLTDSTDTLEACDLEACTFNVGFFTAASTANLRIGFQVAVENSGKILVIDDVELDDDGVLKSNLEEVQEYKIEQAQDVMSNIAGELEFNLGTATISSEGIGIISASDDAGNTRTKFDVNKSAVVTFCGQGVIQSGSRSMAVALNDTIIMRGTNHDQVTTTGSAMVCNTFKVVAGDYITYGVANNVEATGFDGQTLTNSSVYTAKVHIIAKASSEHIVTPAKSGIEQVNFNSFAGYGSTNTKVPYWSVEATNTISDLGTMTNDSTNGAVFTANRKVVVVAAFTSSSDTGGNDYAGIFKNAALSTNPTAQATSTRIAYTYSSGYGNISISGSTVLEKGDTLAVLTEGSFTPAAGGTNTFSLTVVDFNQQILSAIPTQRVAYVKEALTLGTSAGDFTTGAWRTRTLNDVSGDTSFVSLASNQFTLSKGKYLIEAKAPAYSVNRHTAIIYNITDSVEELKGTSEFSSSVGEGFASSKIKGTIEISSSKTFELQHQCQTTNAGTGFGIQVGYGSEEVFAQIKITKLK